MDDPGRRPRRRRRVPAAVLVVLALAAGGGATAAAAPRDAVEPAATAAAPAAAGDTARSGDRRRCGPVPAEARRNGYDSATRGDREFNRQFCHGFARVDDVTMHYVVGGEGPPLVLLHGWPESWFEWRGIMPELARRHTVIAVDLPGLGDSLGAPPSYDKATLARYVHGLVTGVLGYEQVDVAAHDLGAGVAFRWAVQQPEAVGRLAHLDYPLPGPGVSAAQLGALSWHFAFHYQERIPEALVDDEVRTYLELFYPDVAFGSRAYGGPGDAESPFTPEQVDEYARTYQRPQVLTGGFELYRTLFRDEQDNLAAQPIAQPVLLLAGQGTLGFSRPVVEPLMSNIQRAVEVPRAGHWLPQENPEFVTRELLDFFAR